MDSAALQSLTPLLDGIDRWVELAPLLPVIISLELVLSADNAVALAAITRGLNDIQLQNKALNIGITISLFFRILLIIFSQYLLQFKILQLICGIYLLSLSIQKLIIFNMLKPKSNTTKPHRNSSLLKVILVLSVTDLAFSIDSITAAVSISDQLLLIITGASIGVIALRFTSSLFVRLLEIFDRLEFAGYLAIGLIGFKLILQLLVPSLDIPEYVVFTTMIFLFLWGFSNRTDNNIFSES